MTMINKQEIINRNNKQKQKQQTINKQKNYTDKFNSFESYLKRLYVI